MTSQLEETFGQYIKRHRISKGFTLTELAAKLKLDSANLSKIENGKRELNQERLPLLAKALDLDTQHIKEEYFSDLIAKKLYENNCTDSVLELAEEKVKYYRSLNK